ncbi:MAG: glutamine--fructose-6-phosphate transaminase (isomerizing) [Bacteroidetes bacterium QS_9_68_14]|nr:MAG: glutamine--fructose-6-phosphate transaminase (isomerizing) [Bacteroidetes bacterium QS_9_68_14]
MCGIVGYIGDREAEDILVKGLERLEYRGYDSAGVAIVDGPDGSAGNGQAPSDEKNPGNGHLSVHKKKGKVSALRDALGERKNGSGGGLPGSVGIGHTRWATHGAPSDVNAHPHTSSDGRFALVHNGIIENYAAIKERLREKGHAFESDTDTEVLVRLIDDVQQETGLPLEEAVRQALTQTVGAYGIVVASAEDPDLLIAARNGSPLILGVGDDGEHFIGSDAAPLIEHTRQVVYLEDGEMVVVRRDGYDVKTIEGADLKKEIHELEWDLEEIEKGGYEHFMLKEIMEQPTALEDCMRGRINPEKGQVLLGGLTDVMDALRGADRVILVACGTSWHSALVGEYLIESLAEVPVEVEYASEFRYREPILRPARDVVIAISQSGETADTLAAVREAQNRGALALGICNVVGSTIARETDAGVYLHAGPEIGVASTKAFTCQVCVLTMIALAMAEGRTLTDGQMQEHLDALAGVPEKVRTELQREEEVADLAKIYRQASNFLYLGRGYNFPVALEGALKLKEISYIHAEGYPAAEMKHGPIALIDRFMPVVFIAMKDSTYDKVVSNIEEVDARDGAVIAITNADNHELDDLAEYVMRVPETMEYLSPLLTVVPLQLLSYHMAVMRGCDVDQPRNLAKSVTVE